MADGTMGFGNGQQFNVSGGVATGANAAGTQAIAGLTGGNSFSSYVPPNTNAPVNSGQITGGSPLNLPTAPASANDNGSSLVAGVLAGTQQQSQGQSATPALDSATSDYNAAQKSYTDLSQNSPDESQMFSSIENQAGLPGQKNTIDQLKTDLAARTAQYNQKYQDIASQGVSSGTPGVFYEGEVAFQQRQASVELGARAAILSALQGNYTDAENKAKMVADMQFKAAEDKITNSYNFLKLNQDTLTKAQADTIKTQADQQKVDLTAQKDNVKTALASGVQSQFWTKPNGTVVRTNDGKEYSTPQQAIADGVLPDFSNAPRIQPVGKSETKTMNGHDWHIVYDQAGNVLSKVDLGASGKGKSNTLTPSTKLPPISQRQTEMSGFLDKVKGQDGYVSPQDWSKHLNAWVKSGYGTTANFKTTFGNYKNPADPKDYK